MTAKRTARPTTEAQVAANRSNATRSTGPTTPEGKARARDNATTHGVYAQRIAAIQRGPIQEDPAALEALSANVAARLGAADDIEHVAVQQITGGLIRLTRLDCLEDAVLRSTSSRPGYAERVDARTAKEGLQQIAVLQGWESRGRQDEADLDPMSLVQWLLADIHGGLTAPGLWDDDHTPDRDNHEVWYTFLRHAVHNAWPEPEAFPCWLAQRVESLTDQALPYLELVSNDMIDALPKLATLRTRILRDVERTMDLLDRIQSRELSEPCDVSPAAPDQATGDGVASPTRLDDSIGADDSTEPRNEPISGESSLPDA